VTGFQEVSREGMAKGVAAHWLCNTGPPHRLLHHALERCGRNYVLTDGRIDELAATAVVELGAGDRFVSETPGGGGYGTGCGDCALRRSFNEAHGLAVFGP
jgi:5-oxoprolinase (ATP-hydrolysing)